MNIVKVPIKRIRAAAYNPRIDLAPDDPAYQHLKRTMEEFGCVEPLVWNKRTGNLAGGHQRFKILKDQGATQIDVVVIDFPLDKEKALDIALNKITGDWDESKLSALLSELIETPGTGAPGDGWKTRHPIFHRSAILGQL